MSEEINEPQIEVRQYPPWILSPTGLPSDLPSPSKDPAAPIKLCSIEANVPEASLAVIREYPNIESSRAVIMSTFGQMPPESANTYHLLKEWVETTFHRALSRPSLLKPAAVPHRPSGIELGMVIDRDETYTTRMRRSTTSTGIILLNDGVIEEIISNCDNMDDLMQDLMREARDQANESGLSNEDTETTDSGEIGGEDNHETQDETVDLARGEQSRLREYIIERFAQQLDDRGI